ncbi:carcinoembryonic antigen-related cell adhesion molecule 16-like [Hemicordylus capensis]|uniref:carcinoembryonic antigen-related cell adhesion molecule 16-like n=1 Tax=Hemicordylus capensis TaxID=884348 RepID=UPI00230459DF|nr:carcinoembryonic antigen-related cell adhesion molecule 16-like [Hemicordylus capensis]
MGWQGERLSRAWVPAPRWWMSPWSATLLAVSLLLPPAAGLSVTQEPANLTEGGNVTLTPQGIPDSFIMNCGWFRGETTDRANRIFIYYPPPSPRGQINGAANTGRERRVPTCSLRISDLMLNYSGVYTVVVTLASAAPAKASVKIAVSEHFISTDHAAVIGLALGILAAAALIGGLLYYFLRVRGRSDPSSTQAVSAYSIYENISPSGQVKAEGSLDSNHTTYQALQHGDRAVYDRLKW